MSVFYFNLSPLKVKYVFMHIFVCTYKHTNIYSVKTFLLVQHFQVNSNQIRSYSSSYNNNIQISNLYRTTSIIITLTFFLFFFLARKLVSICFFFSCFHERKTCIPAPPLGWPGAVRSFPLWHSQSWSSARPGNGQLVKDCLIYGIYHSYMFFWQLIT